MLTCQRKRISSVIPSGGGLLTYGLLWYTGDPAVLVLLEEVHKYCENVARMFDTPGYTLSLSTNST